MKNAMHLAAALRILTACSTHAGPMGTAAKQAIAAYSAGNDKGFVNGCRRAMAYSQSMGASAVLGRIVN